MMKRNNLGGFLQSPLGHAEFAGIGAFAGGMRSGDGRDGNLRSFAGEGPIGAIVGGCAGAVGGLFGKSKAMKAAQKPLTQQELEAFIAETEARYPVVLEGLRQSEIRDKLR